MGSLFGCSPSGCFTFVALAALLCVGCADERNPLYPTVKAPKKSSSRPRVEPRNGGQNDTTSYAPNQPTSSSYNLNESPQFASSGTSSAGGASAPNASAPTSPSGGGSYYGGGQSPSHSGQAHSGQASSGQASSGQASGIYRAAEVQIRLPTALPQTGPNGTLMSFSIEYEFVSGMPSSHSSYYLVVRGKQGIKTEWLISPISRKSPLTGFVDGWRPEYGPFTATIEEEYTKGVRRAISSRAQFNQ